MRSGQLHPNQQDVMEKAAVATLSLGGVSIRSFPWNFRSFQGISSTSQSRNPHLFRDSTHYHQVNFHEPNWRICDVVAKQLKSVLWKEMEQYPIFHLSCGVTLSHLRPQKKKEKKTTEIPNASSKALRRWGRWRGCVFMRTCANHWPLLQRCSCLEWFGGDHLLRKLVQLCKTGWCLWKALTFLLANPKYSPRSLQLSFPTSQPQINHFEGEIWMVPLLYGCGNGLVYPCLHPTLAAWDEANIIWMAS